MSDGVALFIETYGDLHGDPILFLHVLDADHHVWEPEIEPFIRQGFRFIARTFAVSHAGCLLSPVLGDTFCEPANAGERLLGRKVFAKAETE